MPGTQGARPRPTIHQAARAEVRLVEQVPFYQWLLERFGFPVALVAFLLWRDVRVLQPMIEALRELTEAVKRCNRSQ